MYYIYLHINKINNKKYCGMTKNINRRWRNNGIEYKPKKYENKNRPFWNAIVKYGWDNFEHIIIDQEENYEKAKILEKKYIKEYDLRNKDIGYNIAIGGEGGIIYKEHPRGMLGKTHSEEYKSKLSEMMKGENNPFIQSGGWVNHEHPRGMLGKTHSEDTKQQISNSLKGRKFSSDHKQKISNGLKGKKKSQEHNLNNSKSKKLYFKNNPEIRPNSSKWAIVIYPDGTKTKYKTLTECLRELHISHQIYRTIRDSGQPYYSNREKYKHLNGIFIYTTIDDTELTE